MPKIKFNEDGTMTLTVKGGTMECSEIMPVNEVEDWLHAMFQEVKSHKGE